MSRKAKTWLGVAVAIVVIAAIFGFRLLAEPTPRIIWSPPELQVVLSQGQSRTFTATFLADQQLRDVSLETVPEIERFINIKAQTIADAPANVAQPVDLTFAAVSDAPIGTYEGTIHLRQGSRTYPQTLKVSLQIVSPLGIGLTTLVQRSRLVVLGTVLSVQSAFDQPGDNIFTTVGLSIRQVLKGSPPTDTSTLVIQLRGGTVGETSTRFLGSPSFSVGESVVVLLDGPDSAGNYSIPSQALGTFHISADQTLGDIVIVDEAYRSLDTIEVKAPDFRKLIIQSADHKLTLTSFLSALGMNL